MIGLKQPSGVTGTWTLISGAASMLVAGSSLTGQFTISAGASQLRIGASGVGLSLGNVVTVSGGSGTLVLGSSGALADLSAATVTLNIPGLSPASLTNLAVQVNTQTSAAIDPTTNVALPAGPYLQVAATIPQTALIVAGSTLGQIQGSLLVQQQTINGAATTLAALSGVSVWVGSATSPSVYNGSGVLVIAPRESPATFPGRRRPAAVASAAAATCFCRSTPPARQ